MASQAPPQPSRYALRNAGVAGAALGGTTIVVATLLWSLGEAARGDASKLAAIAQLWDRFQLVILLIVLPGWVAIGGLSYALARKDHVRYVLRWESEARIGLTRGAPSAEARSVVVAPSGAPGEIPEIPGSLKNPGEAAMRTAALVGLAEIGVFIGLQVLLVLLVATAPSLATVLAMVLGGALLIGVVLPLMIVVWFVAIVLSYLRAKNANDLFFRLRSTPGFQG